jgi:hypothetical protein
MECILYPEQYNFIYNVSFITLGSAIYAIYNGHYDFAICSACVFLTSINYWRKPLYDWRRSLDMACVHLMLSYQVYRGYRSQYMVPYYTLTIIAIGFYPLGIYYYKKKRYWISTYSHCMLHIIANIANWILYSERKA